MSDERARRSAEAAREAGADFALLTSVEAVCYATGLDVSVEWGPSPFLGGPLTALVAPDGTTALVVGNLEQGAAAASRADRVYAYEGFSDVRQPPLERNYLEALAGAVRDLGLGGIAAVEPHALPVSARDALASATTGFADVRGPLDRQRSTKTAEEIEQLRRAGEVAVAGQRAALAAVAAGRTELEIFADIRCAIETAAGGRVALTGDLISGVERTADCEGWPNTRTVLPGDPVIADLAPRVGGYWGDSCNTVVAGEPTPELSALHEVSARALERAAETLRPGITAGEFDAGVRAVITAAGYENPLHIGHSIGTAIHEFPRLVAQETAVLEPDMVLMVEPGAYVAGVGGVRLEWMFRVTRTGNEVLCPFEHVLTVPAALPA